MTTKRKKDRKKPGPAPRGLGEPFTLRLFDEQDERVRKDAQKSRVSKGEIIRRIVG